MKRPRSSPSLSEPASPYPSKNEAPAPSTPPARQQSQPTEEQVAAELSRLVGIGKPRVLRRWATRLVTLLVLGGVIAAGVKWRKDATQPKAATYETEAVKRGSLSATITATGTLAGMDTVDVGAQVTGKIKTIFVDFNDPVTQGQVLCEIDPLQLTAARNQARAKLLSAQASQRSAKATAALTQLAAQRKRTLAAQGLLASQELETAEADAERAQAAVQSAEADVALSQASLVSAQTSLDWSVIKAPINGVVLSRNVQQGQTVTASLQTPVLFTLAKDLTRMDLSINIDESDVGRVKEGQPATFTVDAFPNRKFPATLRSLRNVAKTTDNVITYQAVLTVANTDLILRPGMTATATIETERRDNVLLVPNAALRFEMPATATSGASTGFRLFPGPPMRGPRPAASGKGKGQNSPSLWIMEGGSPKRVQVKTGVTDGQSTEVVQGLSDGQQVVVDMSGGAAG